MGYTDHFRLYLKYGANSYYRVKKENKELFEQIKKSMLSKAKRKRLISESEAGSLFRILIDVDMEEFKHYISEADLFTMLVIEYFELEENSIWQDLEPEPGEEVDFFESFRGELDRTNLVQDGDEGFEFIIFSVIHEYLKQDKGRNPPVTKDLCIKGLILELLRFRRNQMKESIRPHFTLYKFSVIAAVIADIAFDLIPAPKAKDKSHNNDSYFLFAKKGCELARSEEPELFEGL